MWKGIQQQYSKLKGYCKWMQYVKDFQRCTWLSCETSNKQIPQKLQISIYIYEAYYLQVIDKFAKDVLK